MKEKNVREIRSVGEVPWIFRDQTVISSKSDTGSQVLRTTWLYVYQGSKKFYKKSQINTYSLFISQGNV